MRNFPFYLALLSCTAVAALLSGCAARPAPSGGAHSGHWSTTWGTSDSAPSANAAGFSNQTLRLIVRSSIGGNQIRIKLTNVFGSKPLSVGGASIALRQSGAAVLAGSNRALSFGGSPSIKIPAGAYVLSDAVPMTLSAQQDIAVSLFVAADSGAVSMHALALQTSFVSSAGNFVANDAASPFPTAIHTWPFLAAVEVNSGAAARSIVAFGDSITDGYKSSEDANSRWPDDLLGRLQAARRDIAVVNAGIAGNRIWHDAIPTRMIFGPNGLSRFDRDALGITGASHIVVLLGINDIGQASPSSNPDEQVSADEIIVGLKQFALRAHARGIKIIGGTLTPYRGAPYFDETGEAKRVLVNTWIRSGGAFDGVIDFDAAIRDASSPTRMNAPYDSGDHLHPNDAGYRAMADSIDLALFD